MLPASARRWAVPSALLLLCLASFGPLAARLGFYWDDWPTIWFLHFFGPGSFQQGFAEDRPLLAWVFQLTTSLVGESPVAWQFFGIFTRWLYSLSLYWALRAIWPQARRQAVWAALLFAVYPAFRQQYISVTYSNGELVLSAFLASIAIMVLAARRLNSSPRQVSGWLLMGLALALSGFSLFITEYVFGLELLRPLILWLAQPAPEKTRRQRLSQVFWQWAPFLAVTLLFLVWRLFLHVTPRGDLVIFERLSQAPLATAASLLNTVFSDILEATLLGWLNTVNLPQLLDFSAAIIAIYILIVLATGVLAFVFLRWLSQATASSPTPTSATWARQALLLGGLALLLGGVPVWVTNLHIDLRFPWDRFYLSMMFGGCLVLAALLDLLYRWRRTALLLLSLLLGLAAGMHFHDALLYRQDWLKLSGFFWQLTWRIPGLEPGTALLSSDLPFRYYSDNSLTAPLNWTYAPDLASHDMPYLFYDLEARLGSWLPDLDPGTPIQQPYRVTSFTGNTSQAVVVLYAPPRCLKVIEPLLDRTLPYKPRNISKALPLSNPDLILPDGAAHPPLVFGAEPARNWCYYYAKAELAVQQGNWQQAARLADAALLLGKEFTKETASELIPFILGYAHTGQWETALQLSRQAYQAGGKDKLGEMICSTWLWVRDTAPAESGREAALQQAAAEFGCSLSE